RPTPNNYGSPQVTISRLRPGTGYRHVLRCDDVYAFVHLLPDWDRLRTNLNQILLVAGSPTLFGWHRPGTVAVCALPRHLQLVIPRCYFPRDTPLLDRMGVPHEFLDEGKTLLHYALTPATARCFLLLRVLSHELGHHFDRITNPKRWCSRGEPFAERYEEAV